MVTATLKSKSVLGDFIAPIIIYLLINIPIEREKNYLQFYVKIKMI